MSQPKKKLLRRAAGRIKRLASRVIKNLYARIYVFINRSTIQFDPDFYLAQYPDIEAMGVDPYRHYVFHGRHEGRVGQSPQLENAGDIALLDPSKETVLVVSHEASRTGAPILSLNLVIRLQQRYNVIAMVLGEGELLDDFKKSGAIVINSNGLRSSPDHARVLIDKLCQLITIKFALINSIESRIVLPGLAINFVPTISLIHEFAAYIRPKIAFTDMMFWSTEVVFSSTVIHQSATKEFPSLAERPVHILPQGRCEVTFKDTEEDKLSDEKEKLHSVFKRLKGNNKKIVLGAGMIQLRKGVDLFIDCALRVLERGEINDLHFVWVGKGYDPENDVQYSAYLYDQVLRAGLENHITFLPETPEIDVAYEHATAVLITSRLDPLPNVAIDAMCQGIPVLCFERTTGVVDFLNQCGLGEACVARYLHVPELADKLLALLSAPEAIIRMSSILKENAAHVFSMDTYVRELELIAASAVSRAAQEKLDSMTINESSVYREDFVAHHLRGGTRFETVRLYVRAWASDVGKRKLFPGFHPGVFADLYSKHVQTQDPLASYLRHEQPSGPWLHEVITPNTITTAQPELAKIALHVHVYYIDLFDQLLGCLNNNKAHPDLFLSVPNEQVRHDLQASCQRYKGKVIAIEVVPNKGRDIGPFLSAFDQRHLTDYEIVGHLHTKKTKDYKDPEVGQIWYNFLLENLLGSSHAMADVILAKMIDDPRIGLVFADDPNVVGWDANHPYAEQFSGKLGLSSLPSSIVFPIGTMFWARTESLKPFIALGLTWDDYPEEPLPYDGSILHALERLFPTVVLSQGYEISLTNIQNITR
ncbi:rhamnan synthesis F family protein [Pseudomonas sp. dw_612]|uniref:rhamnan synthesis F family protein n=1 Tax=Pseudomonas sp. dw_612 TaxID=2720080 RepID=UPI001BD65AA6|nr:rhamnan synthesis F family protein [Pseudomonas sp. dw_612]